MEEKLELGIVRINKADSSVAGSGFLISKKHIMTCTHVVAFALGFSLEKLSSLEDQDLLHKEISLVFAVIDITKSIRAKIVKWYPVASDQKIKDIAVLEIIEDMAQLPTQACPVSVLSTKNRNLHQHKFDALGFPQGSSSGKWVEGKIMGAIANSLVQIQGENTVGGRIEPGYSGTAIWDRELKAIVGMATKEAPLATEKIGFMKPTEVLIEAWPDLSQVCRDDAIKDFVQLLEDFQPCVEENINCKWAYYQSIPLNQSRNLRNENIDSPHNLINSLVKVEKSLEKQKAVLSKFAGLIILQLQKLEITDHSLDAFLDELYRWIEIYGQQDRQRLLSNLQQQYSPKDELKNYLLVCFVEETENISVKSWFVEENRWTDLELNESESLPIQDCQNIKDEELGKLIENLKLQCLNLSVKKSLDSIHYFLPLKLLENKDLSIDSLDLLPIDSDDPFAEPSCFYHNVAIRLNRSGLRVDKISHWEKKGSSLDNAEVKTIFKETKYVNAKSLHKELYPEAVLGTKFINVIDKDDLKSIMQVFLHAGIPLAIWKRKVIENGNQNILEDLSRENSLNGVFQRIQECRQQGADDESHLGHYLSVLWDDPKILTPDLKKMYKMP